MKTPPSVIAIDENAIRLLSRSEAFAEEWFENLAPVDNSTPVPLIQVADVLFLLHGETSLKSRLIVIPIKDGVLLSEIPRRLRPEAFDRIVKGALSRIEMSVAIPTSWRPYHKNSRISFHSNSRHAGDNSRVLMDVNPEKSENLLFGFIPAIVFDLDQVPLDYSSLKKATAALPEAIALFEDNKRLTPEATARNEINLDDQVSRDLSKGGSFNDWYTRRLTKQQLRFVDLPLDRSVRLRGKAGTGKTLALVIKFTKALYNAIDTGDSISLVFLTHSMATVDVVRRLIENFDERSVLYSHPQVRWKITTLQELANDAMSYDLSGLTPISNDGLEGRKLQLEAIESVVGDYRASDWPLIRARCSENFRDAIEAEKGTLQHKYFCYAVMNEFACVLDAEGVRESTSKRKKYLSAERRKWMMPLANREERTVILDIYTRFRRFLHEMDAIGVDQMISDYLGYLDSFRWDTMRKREGYDAVFVDELHLFNRQERMVFQFLNKDSSSVPVVIMAHDAKQSPRDTFVDISGEGGAQGDIMRSVGLGPVEKIELQTIFRYTPEIADFLASVDSMFPGIDFNEEWEVLSGITETAHGPKPLCCEVDNFTATCDVVFDKATRWAQKLGTGRRVAVLTLSEDLFSRYLESKPWRKNFEAISARDDLTKIRYAGKRFIFSRPEYVAGLQFEAVILIDVNKDELLQNESSIGAKRRFVSELYLGASRAERILEIYAQKERGGFSDILSTAMTHGTISKVDISIAKTTFP